MVWFRLASGGFRVGFGWNEGWLKFGVRFVYAFFRVGLGWA